MTQLNSYKQEIEEADAGPLDQFLVQNYEQTLLELEILNLLIKYVGKIYIIKYLCIIHFIYWI
jgi:hypothetical protein